MSHLSSILDIIICIVNLCVSSGVFPTPCKFSIIFPLITEQGLDPEILKNDTEACDMCYVFNVNFDGFF